MITQLRERARQLKREIDALALACRDPRTPWIAKALAVCVVAYALSPIDLIPDFVPVLGYLDDLILLPLGIALTIRLIPREIMDESRAKAAEMAAGHKPRSIAAAVVIVLVWIALTMVAVRIGLSLLGR